MTQLGSVTCHMGSHSFTCYPTQVNAPRLRLHPSQTGWYSIYRPFKGGGLSKPRPRVQRATGPLLLYATARSQRGPITGPSDRQSSTLTTRLSQHSNGPYCVAFVIHSKNTRLDPGTRLRVANPHVVGDSVEVADADIELWSAHRKNCRHLKPSPSPPSHTVQMHTYIEHHAQFTCKPSVLLLVLLLPY